MSVTTGPTPPSAPALPTAPYPLLPLLGRGLAAGGLAGLLSGLFSLLLAEPLMDRAIRLEEQRSASSRENNPDRSPASP
ncbi:CbtA family protein, partial [Streptomyces albus]|uniref:CbtA family protein n=1 Tax=Streptomyces albus TaxID=1888 RepID=UPI00196A0987